MSKCQGVAGWLLGHKFSGRYSEGEPHRVDFKGGSAYDMVRVLNATKAYTYEGDVCERCGEIRKQPS